MIKPFLLYNYLYVFNLKVSLYSGVVATILPWKARSFTFLIWCQEVAAPINIGRD